MVKISVHFSCVFVIMNFSKVNMVIRLFVLVHYPVFLVYASYHSFPINYENW